jgi:transcriptional regulator with XRE-family HTH domain
MVRRQLGRRLRRLREEAGKTHADVATVRIASPTKMWRIESGKAAVKPGDVWALARLYNLSTELTDALVALALGTHDVGWWAEYAAVVPQRVGLYTGLEAASSAVYAYQPELVPGLLQTEDYARAVIRADDRLSDEEVEQRVAFRLGRQRAVVERAGSGRVTAVLGAGALELRVGSEAVMEAQLRRLRALSDGGRVDTGSCPGRRGHIPRCGVRSTCWTSQTRTIRRWCTSSCSRPRTTWNDRRSSLSTGASSGSSTTRPCGSRSTGQEFPAAWPRVKASASDASGECVENRAMSDGGRQVRDSKDRGRGPVLTFTKAEWEAFLDGVRRGEFG